MPYLCSFLSHSKKTFIIQLKIKLSYMFAIKKGCDVFDTIQLL